MAGLISSGVLAFAADAPLSGAINTTMGPGKVVTTSQLSLNFVRPGALTSGAIRVRGDSIHTGRRQGLAEARIEDAGGKLLAHGTTRCVVVDLGVPPENAAAAPVQAPEPGWTPVFRRPLQGSPLSPEVWAQRTGLEIVRGMMDGELPRPPLAHLFGTRLEEASEGLAVISIPATPWLCPPAPTVYGGSIALFGDIAVANALMTTLPAGVSYATLDLIVYFIRPVLPDGRRLTAHAEVVHRGRGFAVAECTIDNGDGKTVARVVSSGLILDRPF